jgi:hypothetical protein
MSHYRLRKLLPFNSLSGNSSGHSYPSPVTHPDPTLLGALRLRRWVLSSWGAVLPAPPAEGDGSWRLFLAREACALRLKGRMAAADLPPVLAAAADEEAQILLLLRAELQEVLAVAAPLGITPVILKGGAALHDPSRAVSAKDLDLLLPDDQGRRLLAALDAAGWRSFGGGTGLHFAERVREGRPPMPGRGRSPTPPSPGSGSSRRPTRSATSRSTSRSSTPPTGAGFATSSS